MTNEAIKEAALNLSTPERAELAHHLLLSLETPSEAEVAAEWRSIAKQRAAAIDAGSVELLSAEAVQLKAALLLR